MVTEHPSQTLCPHCARALSQVGPVSNDHVVGRAFGGVETVRACKRCNDVLGGGLEARLLSPTGWFTILSQAAGFTAGSLKGTTELGQRAEMHFGQRGHRIVAPSHEIISDAGGVMEISVTLPAHIDDSYLDHLGKKYGGEVTIVSRSAQPPAWHKADLSASLDDLRRLAAKIALCTGAARWGDTFLANPFANWLRIVLDVWSDWPENERPEPLDDPLAGGRWPATEADVAHMTGQAERTLGPVLARAAQGFQPERPPPLPPITMFAPLDGGNATFVTSIVLGVLLPGLPVPHPLPMGALSPTVIIHPTRAFGTPGADPAE
jgi:hypothetical protein